MQRSLPQAEQESMQGRRNQLFWDVAVKWGDARALSELATVWSRAPGEKTDYLLLSSGSDPQLCAVLRADAALNANVNARVFRLCAGMIMTGFTSISSPTPI
jgi:hypothetical protein